MINQSAFLEDKFEDEQMLYDDEQAEDTGIEE